MPCLDILLTMAGTKTCNAYGTVRGMGKERPLSSQLFKREKHQAYPNKYLTWQSVQMFIGEMGCWLVVFGFYLTNLIRSRYTQTPILYQPIQQDDNEDDDATLRPTSQQAASPAMKPFLPNADDRATLEGWKVTLLALPACCDITGTTLMNVGLLFVVASIYQMTRGALVLFVGAFSVLFLKRKLYLYHWLSLVVVVTGVALVGLAGAISSGDKSPHSNADNKLDLARMAMLMVREVATQAADEAVLRTVLGVFLIAFAQIFTATQFVLGNLDSFIYCSRTDQAYRRIYSREVCSTASEGSGLGRHLRITRHAHSTAYLALHDWNLRHRQIWLL